MVNDKSFVVLIAIMTLLSQKFAQCLKNLNDLQHTVNSRNCTNWIIESGFHAFKIENNRKLAKKRDRKFDFSVPVWAVMYAHILTAFPKLGTDTEYTPQKYCYDQGMKEDYILPFETLENFQKTCEEWIQLYNYSIDDHKSNWDIAKDREKAEDGVISLWAAGYANLISSFEKNVTISIAYYCGKVVKKDKKLPFMSLNETKMSCKEWIELSGYTNNIQTNLKIVRRSNPVTESFLNTWTQLYADYLRNSAQGIVNVHCCGLSRIKQLKPLEFCNFIVKKSAEIPVKYFEENIMVNEH